MREDGGKEKLYAASLSGGKDSTAMVLRLVEEGWPLDFVMFCDTGLEFPQMYEHVGRLEKELPVPVVRLKAEKDFEYYFLHYTPERKDPDSPYAGKPGMSWAGPKNRWCTSVLKTAVINRYLSGLRKRYEVVQYIGIAADEPQRVKEYRYPLVEWGMTERDCLAYCYERGYDWGGLYRLFDRVSCWCCPLQGLEELRTLRRGVALYMTCGDNEWGAEVYGCASDRQQASIVFDVAVDMVEQCPALKRRIKPVMSVKRLVYKPTNSFYQVLSAEAYTKHGLNVHAVIFDELHSQPNRELFDVMTKGSGDARTQPLFFLITTAGTDRHSVCFEQHQKAEDILCGRKVDPTFYPVIYGAADDADWTSEEVWYRANPSLGHTIDIGKVRNACLSARDNPAEENIFRQLRLNQWVKQSTRWMQMEKWDACAFPVDEGELLGRECYGGLDLSSSIDITAFVLVFPPRDDSERYVLLPFFWIPEENMVRRVRRDHVPYDVWERQGFLETTEGDVIHYGFIERFIEELGKRFHIKEIAFDRWGAVQMVQNLEGLGFTVVPFGQGFKDMSPPTKRLMELVLERNVAHGGHPVLRWMMDNIFVRTDPAGNIKPDKEKSTEKIDGAVAAVMALDRAVRNGGSTGSVYDERGILSF